MCRSFTVASINFPGQQHTWRVNPLLQKGSEAAMDSLLNTLAWAAAIINLTASERFTGDVFSIRQSIRSLRMGFHRFLGSFLPILEKLFFYLPWHLCTVDLVFGMPSLQPRDFESRLHEERSRYLVAELLCAVRETLTRRGSFQVQLDNEPLFPSSRFSARKNTLPCVGLSAII